ncbi:hypothetical protein QZH41_015018 [Actinostola sp. cb2023]|nr:hypothetical protein QZH41_015018 [Actinostola sp. cb2023]
MIKPKGHLRARRSLYDFYRMIKCETGRPPSDYNGYGCWCGKGGDGKILDDLDRCCYVHDHCYGEARKSGKCTKWLQIYWDSYDILGCSDCRQKNDYHNWKELVEISKNVKFGKDRNFLHKYRGTKTSRGLLDFGIMIYCGTGRNPFDYNNYGCYCGFGGHGNPLDNVDSCCKAHDQCYDRVHASGVCPFQVAAYTFPYTTTSCTNCKPASYYWFYGRCREALCKCDAESVNCFKRSPYHDKYAGYDKDQC